MENKNLFTELRFKKGNEVHDSGYACIEVVGFNKVIEEERLLTKCSDVIHLPQMYKVDDFIGSDFMFEVIRVK